MHLAGTFHCCRQAGHLQGVTGRQVSFWVQPVGTDNHVIFTKSVLALAGSQVIFKVWRPFYLINSSIYVEDGEGFA